MQQAAYGENRCRFFVEDFPMPAHSTQDEYHVE